jgi:hypothetical protein
MEFALASQYALVLIFKYPLLATNATSKEFWWRIQGVGLCHCWSFNHFYILRNRFDLVFALLLLIVIELLRQILILLVCWWLSSINYFWSCANILFVKNQSNLFIIRGCCCDPVAINNFSIKGYPDSREITWFRYTAGLPNSIIV